MYIDAIDTVLHRTGHGMEFDDLDEAASAIQKLGELMDEVPENVERLITQMGASIEGGVAYSAFAHTMMRHHDGPEYVNPSGSVTTKQGYIIGGRFFVHNSQGLTHRAPFCDLEVRVDSIKPEGEDAPERFQLKLTDYRNPVWSPGLKKPENHTDSQLARALSGHERPLRYIEVQTTYVMMGPKIEFDFISVLEALGDVEGLEQAAFDPNKVAGSFYKQQLDPTVAVDHHVQCRHSNGATVTFDGFFGIQTAAENYSVAPTNDMLIHKQLIKLDGTVVSGPLDSLYTAPYASFTIEAGPDTTNSQLTALAEALEAALWSHQY